MNIVVCISSVPDTTSKINFTENNTKFDSSGIQFVINPNDEFGLTKAMVLKEANGGTVKVITVGDATAEPVIRKTLAIGADSAVRINTEPKDALGVAKQISDYAKESGFDMVLCGKETIDYNGSQVGGMIAGYLNQPFISNASKLDMNGNTATIERDIQGGKEVIQVDTPFVLSAAKGMSEPRIPNMRGIMAARSKALTIVEPSVFENTTEIAAYELPAAKGACRMVSADNPAELLDLLRNEAKII